MIDIATIWLSRHDVTDLCLYIFILIFLGLGVSQIRQCTCLKMWNDLVFIFSFTILEFNYLNKVMMIYSFKYFKVNLQPPWKFAEAP